MLAWKNRVKHGMWSGIFFCQDVTSLCRLRDGRYRALIPCGERLVVSVQLKNQHPIPRKNKNLCQALDSPYVVVNTLPDYIPSTEENCLDSSLVLLQHKRNNLKSQTGKSHMRPKRLKPKILDRDSGFYLHQGNSKLGTSSDDSSDQSQNVIRRVDQDAVHLCRDTVNQYSSYRKKYVRDNRHSESDQSSAKECRKNFENLNSDVLTESSADIASLSDQLQRKYNCSWSLIGVKCFGSDIKDKKEYIDDNSMKTVNTGNADIVGGAGKSKCISCLNLDVNCEVPCICNYSSNYRSRGRGSAVGGASVSHNKEMVIKSSWQCSKNSAFVNNDSRKEEHLLSSQKKNSNSSKENPGIGIGKNNLRETRDSSLADSATEVVTSNPESIKKQDACDGDNNLDDNISAFPKSSCLQSGNSDVGKSLSNLDCFGYLQKSAISPIRESALPGGRRKKNVEVKRKKMQHLFGNEGSIIEKTEPKVPVITEEPELSSGEYTPLKKSLAVENVHFPLPDYIPSPICREQAPGSCERNASSVQTGIEDPDNDRLHCNRSTFGENKGEISFRRSERLQDKVTKALYDVSLIFSSDEMIDEDYKPGQIVKKKNKRKLKVIKQAVSCESSENVNVSSQKVVGSCGKACRKNNKPFSCADTLKDNNDNQEHNPQSEDKLPQKSKIGDTQGKAVNKRKKTVADAKNKQETSGNRQRGKRKCGIFESEKTREGKRVLQRL
ncbi:uncharacterized protein [Macrobrachium rosenbergii]|uniref:uncharacterized protein isoform X2 n=1 Tax=Macrobrachium rosenbergii TaxID=79674 RepID=UPI0034D6C38F